MSRIDKILLPNPDWRVKKVDFRRKSIKQEIEKLKKKKQESEQRKESK